MTRNQNVSSAYQRFLDFFNLTQRERLEGLNSSHFEPMSQTEKKQAFELLKSNFERSTENIKGLYLCCPAEAIALFKKTIKQPIDYKENKWENDSIRRGLIVMIGYVAQIEPTKENINRLVTFDIQRLNKDARRELYNLTPSRPTTTQVVEFMEKAIFYEAACDNPVDGAVELYLSFFGISFDPQDPISKKFGMKLLSSDIETKKEAIHELKKCYRPQYID